VVFGGIKYSMKAEKLLEQYINRCVASFKVKKKVPVLDLDNTLSVSELLQKATLR